MCVHRRERSGHEYFVTGRRWPDIPVEPTGQIGTVARPNHIDGQVRYMCTVAGNALISSRQFIGEKRVPRTRRRFADAGHSAARVRYLAGE